MALLNGVGVLIFSVLSLRVNINEDTKKSLGYSADSVLNFTELTNKYGYSSEEHTVLTEDGYMLTLFRIKGKNCYGTQKKPPVVFMHGLLQSSDSFIDAGPGAGLAYLISDACFDLWVANCRGNYYSRKHISLNPDTDPEFWNFSIEQIGYYDVPATIDYVLNKTASQKVNYIGYSQGAGTFFVMCSERPGYCDKVNLLIALAPASRLTNTKSALFRLVIKSAYYLEKDLKKAKINEILSKGSIAQEFLQFFCPISTSTRSLCTLFLTLLDSSHPGSKTSHTINTLFGHFTAGTSLHNMAGYGQSLGRQDFTKFDYGTDKNIEVYGRAEAPKYNLSAVTIPVVVLYGRNDGLVAVEDVKWLVAQLPNVAEAMEVANPLWTHFDVCYSQYTKELIFPKIEEHLNKHSFS